MLDIAFMMGIAALHPSYMPDFWMAPQDGALLC
jgi:hypothetical protein